MSENLKNLNLSITVDDGSRRIPILNTNGDEIGAFTFRPTDIGIIDRYNALADKFETITKPLEAVQMATDESVDLSDPKYTGALAEAEKRLREAVDTLLDSEDAAAAFFGKMNPFSPVNGEFYCTQVLDVLGRFIGAQFSRETQQLSARVAKYAKKAIRK